MAHIAQISGFFLLAIVSMPLVVSGQQPFRLPAEQKPEEAETEAEPEKEEKDEIETDRDSFTPATTVVGRKRLVIESSYSFIDNRTVPDTNSLPEVIGRYGISDMIELRFGYNYEVGGAGNPISGNTPDDLEGDPHLERESRVVYGTRAQLAPADNKVGCRRVR